MSKVRCINSGSSFSAVSITEGRIYDAVPDPKAAKSDLVRVIDDSGESCLYPWEYFAEVEGFEPDDGGDDPIDPASRAAKMREQLQQHVDALRHAAHDVTDSNGEPIEDVADIFADGLDRYPDLDGDGDAGYCVGWLAGFAFALGFRDTVDMLRATECTTAVYEREDGEPIGAPVEAGLEDDEAAAYHAYTQAEREHAESLAEEE